MLSITEPTTTTKTTSAGKSSTATEATEKRHQLSSRDVLIDENDPK
ncbi:MAG: hypothetical protein WCW01_04975 [Gammaproteobacteria bacterium]